MPIDIIGKRITVSVVKKQTLRGLLGHLVNLIHNVVRHWEFCSAETIDQSSRHEGKKIVSTLFVPGGVESYGTNRARAHRIVHVLVGLHIFAELKMAVQVIVDLVVCDNRSGTLVWQDGS